MFVNKPMVHSLVAVLYLAFAGCRTPEPASTTKASPGVRYACGLLAGLFDAFEIEAILYGGFPFAAKGLAHVTEKSPMCEKDQESVEISQLSLEDIADVVNDKISAAELKATQDKLIGTFMDLRSLTVLPAQGNFDVPAQLTNDLRDINGVLAIYSDQSHANQLSVLTNYVAAAGMKVRLLVAKLNFFAQSAEAATANRGLWQQNARTVYADLKSSVNEQLAFIDDLRTKAVPVAVKRLFKGTEPVGGIQTLVTGIGMGITSTFYIDIWYPPVPLSKAEQATVDAQKKDPDAAPLPLLLAMKVDLNAKPVRLHDNCDRNCNKQLPGDRNAAVKLYQERVQQMQSQLENVFQTPDIAKAVASMRKLQELWPRLDARMVQTW